MDDQTKDFVLNISSKIDVLHELSTDVRIAIARQESETKQNKEVLDKLVTSTVNLEMISTQQQENLKQHMQRTSVAETRLDNFENDVRPILEGFKFIKKIGGFAVGLAGIIKAISLFWK